MRNVSRLIIAKVHKKGCINLKYIQNYNHNLIQVYYITQTGHSGSQWGQLPPYSGTDCVRLCFNFQVHSCYGRPMYCICHLIAIPETQF